MRFRPLNSTQITLILAMQILQISFENIPVGNAFLINFPLK
jgi:hypothetical protein